MLWRDSSSKQTGEADSIEQPAVEHTAVLIVFKTKQDSIMLDWPLPVSRQSADTWRLLPHGTVLCILVARRGIINYIPCAGFGEIRVRTMR